MELQKQDKRKIQTEQQIFHLLISIVESHDEYTFSEHLCHIMRKKNEENESFFWDDEKLLKKIEDYYDELNLEEQNG